MNTRRASPLRALWALVLMAAGPQQTLDGAARTLARLHAHLGPGYSALRPRAVLVAPQGRRGDGVLLMRHGVGWSEPAFFDAAGLDGTVATVVLIMSDRGLDAVLRQRGLPLDGPDPLTEGGLGQGADLVVWPRARLSVVGFHQDDAANAQWFGHARGAAEIVGGTAPEARTARVRGALP